MESRKLESDASRRRRRDKRLRRSQYSLGKLKDVKDKLFHLDPVGFVRTDEFPLGVHVGDLLLRHVVLQLRLVLPGEHGDHVGPAVPPTVLGNVKTVRPSYCTTSLRKEKLKKWLATFPALNMSRPSALRFSAVGSVISLYSTTW